MSREVFIPEKILEPVNYCGKKLGDITGYIPIRANLNDCGELLVLDKISYSTDSKEVCIETIDFCDLKYQILMDHIYFDSYADCLRFCEDKTTSTNGRNHNSCFVARFMEILEKIKILSFEYYNFSDNEKTKSKRLSYYIWNINN